MNDLPSIRYEARKMYLDMVDMSLHCKVAHFSLFNYTIFNDGPPLNDDEKLRQIAGIESAHWFKTKGDLMLKGWLVQGPYFLHRKTVESVNEAKMEAVSNHNQTAAANKKTRKETYVRDTDSGILAIRDAQYDPTVMPIATNDDTHDVTHIVTYGGKNGQAAHSRRGAVGRHKKRVSK